MAARELRRLLQDLGYGSRREVEALIASGAVRLDGVALSADAALERPAALRVAGEPLDLLPGALVALHKPPGYECSAAALHRSVFQLLPPRWRLRRPPMALVGRLDLDTSGLLLLTDDGALVQRLTHPRQHRPKVYRVQLADPLRGDEAAAVAAGLQLRAEPDHPLAPAGLEPLAARELRLTLTEGRYHQVKRMMGALGHRVVALHREAIGGLWLASLGLAPGQWRALDAAQRARLLED